MSCLGILNREGGIFGLRVWRVTFACGFGVFLRQDILAGLLGGSVWRSSWLIYSIDFEARKTHAVEQRKEK